MNTKKITALALAALMAAGSTATAFAASVDTNKNQALVFNGTTAYEEDDNGVLVEDKDGVSPGDSIYFLLKDGAFDDIEDKDRDRIKVYADWKMGKDYIKDIKIVYKKGEAVTSGSAVADSKYYTVKIGGKELKVVVGKGETVKQAIAKRIKDEMDADTNFLKDEKADEVSPVEEGFVINGAYVALSGDYATKDTGLIAENKWYENLDGVKTAYLNAEGSNIAGGTELFLPKGYTTSGAKVLQGKVAKANPDAEKFEQATKGEWYVTATTEGNVWAVKTGDKGSLAVKDVVDAGLATEVAGKAIVKTTDSNKVVPQDDKNYIVGADKPAYQFDSTIYVTEKEAMDAAGAAIAAAEAEQLAPNVRAVADISSSIDSVAKPDFTYWVKIDTKESFTTKEQDIAGTLYLGTSKNGAEDKGSELKIGLPLSNRIDDNNGSYVIKDGDTIYPDANGAVKFEDDAEEVTIYFGSNEDAWFTFNAAGQSALNLAYNTKFNKEIADLFPKANIDFISWIATPAANRTGDLYITAKEDTFLYQVTEDGKGIKEVKGADYNEDEGAWHIRTRKLGSYVISDMELDTTAKVEDKDEASSNSSTSSKPNGDKHNPDTGR